MKLDSVEKIKVQKIIYSNKISIPNDQDIQKCLVDFDIFEDYLLVRKSVPDRDHLDILEFGPDNRLGRVLNNFDFKFSIFFHFEILNLGVNEDVSSSYLVAVILISACQKF